MRAKVWIAAMAAALMATGAAAACPAGDSACLRQALTAAEADFAARAAATDEAIDAWDGNLGDADRAEWRDDLAEELRRWRVFVDKRCAFETGEAAGLACRLALSRVMAEDLVFRFDLGTADPSFGAGRPRRSVEESAPPEDTAAPQDDTEFGPCADAPPGDCDYCGANACFDRLTARAGTAMKRALAAALKAVDRRRRPLLQDEQAAFSAWLDRACADAAFETPNRWANSIHAEIVAPCRLAELEARTARLKALARHR